jgi:CDP-glucose 4,6-dehydratase
LEGLGMSKSFENFFKGKSVLITGHTGFIGSWLTIWLNELGGKIVGYALSPYTEKDNFVLTNLEKKIESVIGDVRDFENLKAVFERFEPEIVFHLAAQPILRKSYQYPKETFDVNIGGTVNVFEAFRSYDFTKILINVTSDKCYENREWVWGYRETDRLGGHDPYSSSKACSEIISSAYRRSYFEMKSQHKLISTVRCGNVIGGGDWQQDRIIPDCMRAMLSNKEIIIRNPNSIRPWQFVLEPIRGLLMLTVKLWKESDKYAGAWNFGPDNKLNFSVQEIVERIIKYLGKGKYVCELKSENVEKLHETKILKLDSSKANNYLGWKSTLNIDEVIKFTCDWYSEEGISYNFDVNQIKNYIEKFE